jgi:tRNA (guanine-N7-)-methyltransferase
MPNPLYPRTVKSFVIRAGRISQRQQQALSETHYLVPPSQESIDWMALFGKAAPVTLEIGFGMGQSLLENARAAPEQHFVGIEVHRPGIGALIAEAAALSLQNLRVIEGDAVNILTHRVADQSLAKIQVFFPDPWPKRRHHKRRLLQPAFVQLLQQKLIPGGKLHVATDWEDYAKHIMQVLSATPGLINTAGERQFATDRENRPLTKYERRGQRLGHSVWDLVFYKN